MDMSKPDFDKALNHVIDMEGDYADLKDDPGGKTRYGITQAVARKHGYKGHMKDFPFSMAKEIYFSDYWSACKCSAMEYQDIAEEVFDTAVNCGTGTAQKIFQKSINLFYNQRDFIRYGLIKVKVDGRVGSGTLLAYSKIPKAWMRFFLKVLNGFQFSRYVSIITNNNKLKKYIRSWLRRV